MGIFFSKIPERQQEGINLNENGHSSSHRERRRPTDASALHRAALKDEWDAAEELFTKNKNLIKTRITEGGEIALHIAAAEGNLHFVSKLLEIMEKDDVATQNNNGCTALCLAAAAGHIEIAETMLKKYPNLANVKGENGVWPFYMAALQGFDDMADYLYKNSEMGDWTPLEMVDLLTSAIDSELYDLAMRIVHVDKSLAVAKDSNGATPLQVLAEKPFAFSCDNNGQGFWDKITRNVLPYMKKPKTNNDMNAKCDAYALMHCLWNVAESCKEDIEAAHIPAESARSPAAGAAESAHTVESAGAESANTVAAGAESAHIEAAGATESANTVAASAAESADIVAAGAAESAHIPTESANTVATGAAESANIVAARARGADSCRLFFVAAKSGNDEFLAELYNNDHNLLYKVNKDSHSIFHIAVLNRYDKVFNLIFDLRGTKDLIATYVDDDGNNMLHLAGKLAPQNQLDKIPGAPWQMQREVLWFKVVEKVIRPAFRNKKNKKGQTPHELFLADHKDLRTDAAKFMKQTAKSCMLVAMLIATVVFTTAFTVPGGYNTRGAPILESKRMFMIFPVSEAVATLSSLTSMLMFLSILTSPYSDEDFLKPLPYCMVVGVSMLFFSIAAMMVAFCSCLLFFEHGWAAVALLLFFFGSVPTMFVVLKYPLLVTILRYTYSGRWLFRSQNRLHS